MKEHKEKPEKPKVPDHTKPLVDKPSKEKPVKPDKPLKPDHLKKPKSVKAVREKPEETLPDTEALKNAAGLNQDLPVQQPMP